MNEKIGAIIIVAMLFTALFAGVFVGVFFKTGENKASVVDKYVGKVSGVSFESVKDVKMKYNVCRWGYIVIALTLIVGGLAGIFATEVKIEEIQTGTIIYALIFLVGLFVGYLV